MKYQDNFIIINRLTNLDSNILIKNPNLNEDAGNKEDVDDTLGESTVLRFDEIIENFKKVNVADTV